MGKCVLPWLHLATTQDGKIKPCCVYEGETEDENGAFNIKHQSLEYVWNSEYMQNIRSQFLNDEFPAGCVQCKTEELAGKTSKRMRDKNKFSEYADRVHGTYLNTTPVYLDVKLGNFCNLKCRICSSVASSKWVDEEIYIFNDKLELVEKAKENKEYGKIDYDDFWGNLRYWLPKIDYMDFTGGEPLLIKEHFRLLDHAIEHGYAKNIELHYNTNGTVPIKDYARDLWSHFKHVNIMFSIDDIGERFEYQRHPAKWDKVYKNLIDAKEYDFIDFEICCTVNIMNIYNLPDIIKQFNDIGFKYWLNVLHGPERYNIKNILPTMKSVITKRLEVIDNDQIAPIIEFMNSEQYHQWADFIQLIKKSDTYRKEDFYSIFKEYENMDKKMKVFCTAPWTHTYVSPQGERRLCCASREEPKFQKQYLDADGDTTDIFKPDSLEEHWNSEHMKSVRKRILNGEEIPECEVCNHNVLNLHTYRTYFTKTLFPEMYSEVLSKTDDDGATTMQPVSFDYRLNNTCNFKCRMCGEQLSSAWEAEKKKHGIWDPKVDKWMRPEFRIPIKEFQENTLEAELQSFVDNGTVKELYWVGGEPLMWKRHWSIMQQLVDDDLAKDVTIRYNTNLSKISQGKSNLYDMLTHFKSVNVCASIDAAGPIGEYIRTGLRWDSWISDFKKGMFLIDKYGDDALAFDITLTTPGLFGMKEMFDLALELGVKSYIKTTYAFDPKVLMCPRALPRKVFDKVLDDLIAYCEPKVTPKTQIYVDAFKDLKAGSVFEEEYPDHNEGFFVGRKRILKLEQIRNDTDITFSSILKDNCTEAYSWFTREE